MVERPPTSERPVHRTRTTSQRSRSTVHQAEAVPAPISTPVENLLRSLLGASGRRDACARIVEGSRALADASWAALMLREEDRWVCGSVSGPGPRPGESWSGEFPAATPGRCSSGRAADGQQVLVLPLTARSSEGALVVQPAGDGRPGAEEICGILDRVAVDLEVTLRRGIELDTLREQVFLDSLTDCYNRRGFDEHLTVELLRAQRYERSTALMLVDLDCFKTVNDGMGHQAGDHVLRGFCSLLASTYRSTDIVSRFGGDEFAVVFPETTAAEAVRLAARVRDAMPSLFPDGVVPRAITGSFGIAAYPEDADSTEALIAAADRALYLAKAAGRDRIVAATMDPSIT